MIWSLKTAELIEVEETYLLQSICSHAKPQKQMFDLEDSNPLSPFI